MPCGQEGNPMNARDRLGSSCCLAVVACVALAGAAAAQTAAPAPPARPNARKNPAATRETEWPKKLQLGDTSVTLDAPEAESLAGSKLKARGTARIQRTEDAGAAVATLWYEADVRIDRERRIVTLVSVSVPRVQLPGAPPARQQRLATRLGQAVTRHRLTLPLDDVLAAARLAARRDETPPRLGTDPPKIVFETEPAVLVVFDGAPRFRAVEGTTLERALNTPFLVLRDPASNACYLDGGTMWFRAPDAEGPWSKADDEVAKATKDADTRVPKILVATEPTELVVSDGAPRWKPEVPGELDAMRNTESDVFRSPSDGRIWLVLS